VFTVKVTARPDPRMVEVPLEIEAELPREFEGAALLASSGLPRKVKIKASRDALKLSTAYRAEQLLGDVVRTVLRGTAQDVQRVQEAVTRFIRTVRERRQEGATLLISSNGRGRIDVQEQLPSPRGAQPSQPPSAPPAAERAPDLLRRIAEMEAALARAGDLADRVAALEQRLTALTDRMSRVVAVSDVAGPGFERAAGSRAAPRRTTAVEAYAEGLRGELRARTSAASAQARNDVERCDRAAALAVEAELLGAPRDQTSQRLRDASAQVAARQSSLERLGEELEFYSAADLPVAAQLLSRLEQSPPAPDPAPSLEPLAQAVRAAKGEDSEARTAWLQRAAALCGWQVVEAEAPAAKSAEDQKPTQPELAPVAPAAPPSAAEPPPAAQAAERDLDEALAEDVALAVTLGAVTPPHGEQHYDLADEDVEEIHDSGQPPPDDAAKK